MRSLRVLLASSPDAARMETHEDWFAAHQAVAPLATTPFDLAILGGFAADRAGFAFASGYQAAIRVLVPELPAAELASLSITERGGAHPRAIETRLDRQDDGSFVLNGMKRWATLGGQAGVLLVAASVGGDARGKNRIRVVRVDAAAPGVSRTQMPEPPFAPEIAHDQIRLTNVRVLASDLCPGDGYADYIKPFRTIEDIFVHAAIAAYLVREARAHALPAALVERLLAIVVALRSLAGDDVNAAETHVALAGALELLRVVVEDLSRVWAKTETPASARWERDRVLFGVAGDAREKRLVRAWERLAAGASEDSSLSSEG